jgi:hypothetical protein
MMATKLDLEGGRLRLYCLTSIRDLHMAIAPVFVALGAAGVFD